MLMARWQCCLDLSLSLSRAEWACVCDGFAAGTRRVFEIKSGNRTGARTVSNVNGCMRFSGSCRFRLGI